MALNPVQYMAAFWQSIFLLCALFLKFVVSSQPYSWEAHQIQKMWSYNDLSPQRMSNCHRWSTIFVYFPFEYCMFSFKLMIIQYPCGILNLNSTDYSLPYNSITGLKLYYLNCVLWPYVLNFPFSHIDAFLK